MKALKIGNLLAPVPIVQGGMGVGISLAGLASAVADQGGIGVISSAGLGVIYKDYSKDYRTASIWGLKQELKKAREATKGIVGVNVMVAMSNFADMVRTAIAEKADIIFSGAGLPLNLPSFLTEGAKTKLAPIVSSEQLVDEHYALESIVPEIVAEVHAFEAEHGCHIPVIAGGGIYTGEDIYRIMSLGAEGVQMGTRFVTTEECDADPAFKQSYLDATQQDIEIIKSPVGMPGRAIHSSFLDRVKEGLKRPKNCPFDCIKTCDVTHSPYCIMLALYNAFKGKLQNGYAFCGANAWRAEKIQSVRDLMASLKAEYDNFSLKGKLFGVK